MSVKAMETALQDLKKNYPIFDIDCCIPYWQDQFLSPAEAEVTPEMLLTVYEHPDCFDIQYSALSKGEGIRFLSEVTGTDPTDMIAVGDWTNDYPMFAMVGHSVGIHLPRPEMASVNFPCLSDALDHLISRIQS